MTPKPNTSKPDRVILVVLTLALLAWGAYHALGVYFGGFGQENLRRDFRRSLVVFGFMAAFLGVWWLLLYLRKSRKSRTNRPR